MECMKRYNGMKLLALVCGIMVLFAFSSCYDGNDDDNVTEETVIFSFLIVDLRVRLIIISMI